MTKRNKKGQFLPKAKARAIIVHAPARSHRALGYHKERPVAKKSKAIVKYRTRVITKAKKTGRKVYSAARANKERIGTTVAAAGYGYLKATQAKSLEFMDKLPGVSSVGRELAWGIALHFASKKYKSKYLDHGATAMLAIGAYNFGLGGFKVSGDDDLGYDGISGDYVDVSGDEDLR